MLRLAVRRRPDFEEAGVSILTWQQISRLLIKYDANDFEFNASFLL